MKTFIFLVSFIFIIGFVSATGDFDDTPDFGYNNKNGPILIPAVNYSLIPTVNNSKYFDGYSVETLYTHYKSLFDLVFAPITEPLSLHLNQDNWFNDSNGWINWDGNSNEFNESKLSTIYYDTNSSDAVAGTIDGGTLNLTWHSNGNYDGITFNFSEASGSPGLDLRLNFTNITKFNQGIIRYTTSSLAGNFPVIQMWSYTEDKWENYPVLAENDGGFVTITQPVFDDSEHIGTGDDLGVVQMRLYKASNGNTQNHYYVDWIAISKGFGTPSGEEVDPFFEQWLNNPVLENNLNGTANNLTNWNWINPGGGTINFGGDITTTGNITSSYLCNATNTCFTLTELNTTGSGGTPGGNDTQIQFNDEGVFNGNSDLTYNKSTNILMVSGDIEYPGKTETEKMDTSDNSNRNLYGVNWYATTFTVGTVGAAQDYALNSMSVKLQRVLNPLGNVEVAIRAVDGGGEPTGADLAVGTMDATDVDTTATAWYDFTMSTSTTLTNGVKYALVVRAPSATTTDKLLLRRRTTDDYAGGQYWSSSNSGSTWSTIATYDLAFRVYGDIPKPIKEVLVPYNGASDTVNLGANDLTLIGSTLMGVESFPAATASKLYVQDDTANAAAMFSKATATAFAVFDVRTQLSTTLSNGKAFFLSAIGEPFARASFYTDGKYGIGNGSTFADVYLSRDAANILKISSNAGDGSASLLVKGKIATGSNTLDGLSDGDINVSVVYYDTLTAKSPAITCSEDWCSVSFPKYQKTLWIQKDNNWNILDIVYDDISYTKQEFNSQICSINSMTLNICVKLNNKIERLQDKRICENSKYLWDGECFEMIKTKTTYTNAIETIQIPVKIEVAKNCTMLNPILQVETYACSEYIETGKMINEVQFKEGCNWNGEYYCETRENR